MESETKINLDIYRTVPNAEQALDNVLPEETSCVACNAGDEFGPKIKAEATIGPDIADVDEEVLDQHISVKAEAICKHHREADCHIKAVDSCWRELMPLLEEKQKRLTSRGKKSDKNFSSFLRLNHLKPSTVRSWRRRLKAEQEVSPEPERLDSSEETSDTPSAGELTEWQGVRDEIRSGGELLIEFAKRMFDVLTGKSVKSDGMRIAHAIRLVKDLQRALGEGKLFDAPPPIVEPRLVPVLVPPSSKQVSLPKPGDCSGLVSNISRLCGDHLKAGLEGLEPEVMANVYGKVVQRLAQMYCLDASGSAVELTVTVQKIARKAPMSHKDIREEWRFAR